MSTVSFYHNCFRQERNRWWLSPRMDEIVAIIEMRSVGYTHLVFIRRWDKIDILFCRTNYRASPFKWRTQWLFLLRASHVYTLASQILKITGTAICHVGFTFLQRCDAPMQNDWCWGSLEFGADQAIFDHWRLFLKQQLPGSGDKIGRAPGAISDQARPMLRPPAWGRHRMVQILAVIGVLCNRKRGVTSIVSVRLAGRITGFSSRKDGCIFSYSIGMHRGTDTHGENISIIFYLMRETSCSQVYNSETSASMYHQSDDRNEHIAIHSFPTKTCLISSSTNFEFRGIKSPRLELQQIKLWDK